MRIHDYDTFRRVSLLENEAELDELYPVRNKKIGAKLQQIIAHHEAYAGPYGARGQYDTPKSWFRPSKYDTFMQYFGRKLTPEKSSEIAEAAKGFSMVMPCEANIESIGSFGDTSSILRLKKPTDVVDRDLEKAGVGNVKQLDFISMKLLLCFYHHIHCPVDGVIQKITYFGREEELFGENSLWLVEFDTPAHGTVYMLLVGESSIQDFDFTLMEGDAAKKFKEFGKFTWGSQVVVIYDPTKFTAPLIKAGEKHFVGDGVYL
jgi:phosphatidylserine decarboxylase